MQVYARCAVEGSGGVGAFFCGFSEVFSEDFSFFRISGALGGFLYDLSCE